MTRFGFRPEDTVILRDDDPNNHAVMPTKANMLRAMQWLVNDARPNDSLFFHYSGHGGQMVDFGSVQEDVYDETIFPVDFKQNGQIVNTVLQSTFLADVGIARYLG
jgi:metacaspase-1